MWFLIRSLLFLCSPEFTHELSKVGIKWLARLLPLKIDLQDNPIGVAAGFDKNAEMIQYLPYFGFGHVEIGTVTPKPQGGNERPRLFRIPKDKNLFNRMGFNNLGAGIISDRVRTVKPHLPIGFKVGVNLGKNKSTPDEEAASDYAKVATSFIDCADYFVINVSSPNTPGLRALQNVESLTKIVRAVQEVIEKSTLSIPLYVKLAPEVESERLKTIIEALSKIHISGFVLTNTLQGVYIYRENEYSGGYSGQILSSIALKALKEARAYTSLPIISVGGIMSTQDAVARIEAGATSIQVYSGWVYQGPFFAKRILKALRNRA